MKVRDKKGRFRSVEEPPFKHKQFVATSDKHFSPKEFTRVVEPKWTETRGWVYGEEYISREGVKGGYGFSFEADLFEPLDNPKDILIAEKLALNEQKQDIENTLKTINERLRHIATALDIIELRSE